MAAVQSTHLNPDITLLNPTSPTSAAAAAVAAVAAASSSSRTEHIFRSRLPDIPINNHLPLHSYLFQNLPETSHRPCLISGATGEVYSYAETHLLCRKTAAGLAQLGLKKGDVIMILLQNCPEFVFTFFGASMIGAVSTTANPFYTSSEIFKQLKLSNAKLVVTQSQSIDKLKQSEEFKMGEHFNVVSIDDCSDSYLPFSLLTEASEDDVQEIEINPDDAVAMPFSSSTGV